MHNGYSSMRIKRFFLLAQTMLAALLLAGCASGPSLPVPAPTTGPKIRPSATLAEPLPPTPTGEFLNHEVAEWDTCESIAEGYSISVQVLIDANHLAADCSDLYLGQVLFIPMPVS